MKLCLVGCGEFARLCHGPALQVLAQRDAGVLLAACCDSDLARAAAFQTPFGFARAYADPGQMLEREKPDGVIVAVPPAVTCGVAVPILERGVPTLLEKPPGLTLAELERLRAAARAGGALVQVAFNRRTMPVLHRAMELLSVHFPPSSVQRIDYEMIRSQRWNEDFSTTAIHGVDALLYLARTGFRAVELRYQELGERGRAAFAVVMEAELAGGNHATLFIQPAGGFNRETVRIHGVGRSLVIAVPASPLSPEAGTLELWVDGHQTESFSDRGRTMVERMGILGELQQFVAALGGRGPLVPGLQDCVAPVAIMEAIRLRQRNPAGLPAA
jgi:predicted dehydrogenase